MLRFLFLILVFSLMLIKPTNADFVSRKSIQNNQFTATTLDFSRLKTTNESNLETLFNIDQLLPGGYQVNTLRIKNQGQSELKYNISFQKISGDDNFCRHLQINLSKNNQIFYQGYLVDLNLNDSFSKNLNFTDWLITLSLDQNYLSNQKSSCQFNLIILGFNQDINQKSGFEYQQIISNNIFSN
ncbi:MAG: hypothetical protein KIH89_004580 [Candidatus Shapirobacteria bacterium]|nr:hypothetical protein [Candidatus Shapirobacteria bacterium]